VRNVVSRGSLRIELPIASETDPHEDFKVMLDADDFKRPEDQRFLDGLGGHDPCVRAEDLQGPAGPMQDPDVRVIDFALLANSKKAQNAIGTLDAAHLIEHIEDIDDPRAKRKCRFNFRATVRVRLQPR
jgi:hypothetical protein